jgi:20S proteasome alpha/beta subunit
MYSNGGGNPLNSMESGDMRKIYSTRDFAFAFSGHLSPDYMCALWDTLKINKKSSEDYIDVSGRLKVGFFDEIRNFNIMQGDSETNFDNDKQTSFIFATKGEDIGLYYIHPMGLVEEFSKDYVCAGSGSEYIEEMLDDAYEFKSLNGPKIDLRKAVNLAQKSIRLAKRDLFSGSDIVDFAIITNDSIDYYGNKLRKELKEFKHKRISEIVKSYYSK